MSFTLKMNHNLIISHWNANGLTERRLEFITYLETYDIDIMLLLETRFTQKTYFTIQGYNCYFTNHPSGNAHGGTGVLVKNKLNSP